MQSQPNKCKNCGGSKTVWRELCEPGPKEGEYIQTQRYIETDCSRCKGSGYEPEPNKPATKFAEIVEITNRYFRKRLPWYFPQTHESQSK